MALCNQPEAFASHLSDNSHVTCLEYGAHKFVWPYLADQSEHW